MPASADGRTKIKVWPAAVQLCTHQTLRQQLETGGDGYTHRADRTLGAAAMERKKKVQLTAFLTDTPCTDIVTDTPCIDIVTDTPCTDTATDTPCTDIVTDTLCTPCTDIVADTLCTPCTEIVTGQYSLESHTYLLFVPCLLAVCHCHGFVAGGN